MSVYVGAKKAKVYKGYYEPAQIFKGTTKIAGFKTVDKSGTSLTGNDTYNDFLPLTISGKSEQATSVQSVNVWDTTIKTQTVSGMTITVANDKKITLNGTANSAIEIKLSENQWVDTTNKNYICSTGINLQTGMSLFFQDRGGNLRNSILSGQNQTQLQNGYVYISSVLKITGGAIFSNFVFYQQCDEGSIPSNYTPFVPSSPSPDYPSPIRSSENFDVVSCGRNLCDNGEVPVADSSVYRVKALNIPSRLKTNVSYTLQLKVKFPAGKYIALYCDAGWSGLKFFSSTGDWQIITTTVTPANLSHSNVGFELYNYPNDSGASMASFEFGVVYDGKYTTETLPPYEPYHATTAHITDPLRSVGDVSDSIEVSDGKVEVVRRVENRRLTASDIAIFNPEAYKNVTYFQTMKKPDDINLGSTMHIVPLLCEFAQFSDYRPSGFDSATQVDKMCTGGNNFYLVGFTHGTTEVQGKEKLANTNYLYALKTPTRTDITATPLGQEFLALRTQPKYTNVYTNATIPPTLMAKIKELEL